MTKSELIDIVAEETKFTKKDVSTILSTVLKTIEEKLVTGEDIRIAGFGVFSIRETAERKGRNPATGEEMTIPAAKHPKFSFGKTVRSAVRAS